MQHSFRLFIADFLMRIENVPSALFLVFSRSSAKILDFTLHHVVITVHINPILTGRLSNDPCLLLARFYFTRIASTLAVSCMYFAI